MSAFTIISTPQLAKVGNHQGAVSWMWWASSAWASPSQEEDLVLQLRYGINPHQAASVERLGPIEVRAGSPSYINLLDAMNAWQLVSTASEALGAPVASSFKHVSPAGAAVAGDLDDVMEATWRVRGADLSPLARAYVRARDADPKSSFGDFIAVSHPVDASTAKVVRDVVSDGIIAPGFEPGALEVLGEKKGGSFLIVEVDPTAAVPQWEERDVYGMRLRQEIDVAPLTLDTLRARTTDAVPEAALRDLLLGMIVLRFTQSNSVAYIRDGMAIGIGAGQQSRVDCTKLAGVKVDTWWLRRSPAIRDLAFLPKVTRQERINWQIRAIEGDLTADEQARMQTVLAGGLPSLAQREEWLRGLDGFSFASDGFIPFRDNIDHAARHGVRYVAEPGGSNREPEVKQACEEHGITHISTGIRLFHH